jgi:hypothetical protein
MSSKKSDHSELGSILGSVSPGRWFFQNSTEKFLLISFLVETNPEKNTTQKL